MVMARRTPSSSTTCCGPRAEVALLVEDVVEGQQALVLFEEQLAAIEQIRRR